MDNIRQFWGGPPADLDKPKWVHLLVLPGGIRVVWREKYGVEKTEECIGIWENSSQYLLTWKDSKKVTLEKSNLNSIEYTKI